MHICKHRNALAPTSPHAALLAAPSLQVMKRQWHTQCLVCHTCNKHMTTADKIYPRNDLPCCETCFMESADKCATCSKPIISKFLTVLGRKYHADGCLGCVACGKGFAAGEKMYQRDGWPVCIDHARGELSPEVKEKMAANPPAAPAAPAAAGAAAPKTA